MIFWFYFTCIKISPRQTSRSVASILNLMCTNDVTCSYDVIMRKRQVLNLTLRLRVLRFSLRPKQFALCHLATKLSWAKVDPSIVVILNYSRPTLNLREEFCHRSLQENKGADQLAHPRSLISTFAIHKLNSIVFKLAPSEISLFYLVSVAEKAGFGMILSGTLNTGFVVSMFIYIRVNADPIHKPGSCDMHIENV